MTAEAIDYLLKINPDATIKDLIAIEKEIEEDRKSWRNPYKLKDNCVREKVHYKKFSKVTIQREG